MGAWRVAAEASSSSAATPSASCLSTHPCRCCAGTYSNATGARNATVCVPCGAGESRMAQAPHVMPAYPTYYLCVLWGRILDENICRQRLMVDM
jgi:hypothetical protein